MSNQETPKNEPITGTFGPGFLAMLSALNQQKQALDQQMGNLLAAYADGRGLGAGTFNWEPSGSWAFTPAADSPA